MKSLLKSLIVVVLVLGAYHLGRADVSPSNGPHFDQEMLNQVWSAVQSEYLHVDEIDEEKVKYGVAKGLVNSLGDEFSTFFDPVESAQFQSALESSLEGIGAELRMVNGLVSVSTPLKNSPALNSGILPGDLIFKIDGVRIKESESLWDVVQRIRGQKGTTVVLTVLHEGEVDTVDISIVRDRIELVTVEWELKQVSGKKFAYVEVGSFTENVAQELAEAIGEIQDDGISDMVLDLRFNGGGFLDGAVDVLSMLVDENLVAVVTEDQGGTSEQRTSDVGVRWEGDLVVLVNDISASASEIVAGALQDHHRAKIVGVTTFGKGSVQVVREIKGGALLKLTIAEWLTPDGRRIHEKGIEPDVMVEMKYDLWKKDGDVQMERAVELL